MGWSMEEDVLIVILDLDLAKWNDPTDIISLTKDLKTFLSLYLAQSQSISVHLYIAHHGLSELLWSSDGSVNVPFELINEKIASALSLVSNAEYSGLASALSKGLCQCNRIRSNHQTRCRILVLTRGSCDASSYIALMNSAFCAQKLVSLLD